LKEKNIPVSHDIQHKLAKAYQRLCLGPLNKDHPPGFDCIKASSELQKEGFPRVFGNFAVDHHSHSRERPHWWNLLRDGSIIDITATQFNNRLNEPLCEGILIIEKDSPLFQRYRLIRMI